jgi:uncharacterized protein YfeS
MENKDLLPLPLKVKPKTYKLSGHEGNAFAIMGTITKTLKDAGKQIGLNRDQIKAIVDEYTNEAMSGDYENLLKISKQYVDLKFVK